MAETPLEKFLEVLVAKLDNVVEQQVKTNDQLLQMIGIQQHQALDIQVMKEDIKEMKRDISILKANSERHDKEIGNLIHVVEKHSAQFEEMNVSLRSMDSRLEKMDMRLEKMDTRLENVEELLHEHAIFSGDAVALETTESGKTIIRKVA